jgi:hypothetical protein
MIIVNVWEPRGILDDHFEMERHPFSPGHASFTIGASLYAPDLTVSWWPVHGGETVVLGDDATVLPYDTEVVVEGCQANKRYRIYGRDDFAAGIAGARENIGLDEAAIRDWWAEWDTNGLYRLRDRSCCTAVIAGLLAGGAQAYASLAGYEQSPPTESLMSPLLVKRLCRAVIEGMAQSRY